MRTPFRPPYASPLFGQRILVVDDVGEDRLLLSELLLNEGVQLYFAQDGQDGYRKAQSLQPDLILMDIHMPVCDGITACRLLKATPATRGIPLIFLTAAAAVEEKISGLSAGAIDYITKPFNFEEMRLRLCIHLKTATKPAGDGESTERLAGRTLDAVLFQAARNLLQEKLSQPMNLPYLAGSVGTNARRLNIAFKHCAGITVFDFLREEKMKEARRMLLETALDIGTIARELGYSNTANFSTAFRERFGMSPTQFRS
ncbi:MAG: DNA-binding response regulator [Burkholderiaceae bacterium]|nr:DNA-binding response regulator [Burkholderiaceae bacterium]